MIRAVIYARYSSHAQKDASIEQQLRVCRQWAREHDIQIVAEYSRMKSRSKGMQPDSQYASMALPSSEKYSCEKCRKYPSAVPK